MDAGFEHVLVDGTIVRLHQHRAGAKEGPTAKQSVSRSPGAPSIKISVMVDTLGNLANFVLLSERTKPTTATSCTPSYKPVALR